MSVTIRYNLGKVTNILKVLVSVIVDTNNLSSFKGKVSNNASITKSKLSGTDLISINIHPYVTIDFTSYNDITEAKNSGVYISNACKLYLNKYNLFLFIHHLRKIERDFIANKDLYYYSNNKLILNKEVGERISIQIPIGDKIVMMKPIVVEVGGGQKEHEGILLALNDLSYSTTLTYTEMNYLLFILNKLDIDNIAINMINLVGENKISTIKNNTVIDIENPNHIVVKEEEVLNDSTNNIVFTDDKNVIPQI